MYIVAGCRRIFKVIILFGFVTHFGCGGNVLGVCLVLLPDNKETGKIEFGKTKLCLFLTDNMINAYINLINVSKLLVQK